MKIERYHVHKRLSSIHHYPQYFLHVFVYHLPDKTKRQVHHNRSMKMKHHVILIINDEQKRKEEEENDFYSFERKKNLRVRV